MAGRLGAGAALRPFRNLSNPRYSNLKGLDAPIHIFYNIHKNCLCEVRRGRGARLGGIGPRGRGPLAGLGVPGIVPG